MASPAGISAQNADTAADGRANAGRFRKGCGGVVKIYFRLHKLTLPVDGHTVAGVDSVAAQE